MVHCGPRLDEKFYLKLFLENLPWWAKVFDLRPTLTGERLLPFAHYWQLSFGLKGKKSPRGLSLQAQTCRS